MNKLKVTQLGVVFFVNFFAIYCFLDNNVWNSASLMIGAMYTPLAFFHAICLIFCVRLITSAKCVKEKYLIYIRTYINMYVI